MGPGYEGKAAAGRGVLRGRTSRIAMTDTQTKKPGKTGTTPNFELPKFDMPKIEVPEAFRDMAEKGVQQAKDALCAHQDRRRRGDRSRRGHLRDRVQGRGRIQSQGA